MKLSLCLVAILAGLAAFMQFTATSTAETADVCQTKKCHERVAAKQRAKARASCRSTTCKRRAGRKQAIKRKRAVVRPYLSWLIRLGRCESGNSPTKNTGNGFYGEFQFVPSTWRSVGGRGMPHHATRLEQRYRAVKLRQRIGNPRQSAGWPVCG